MRNNLLSQKTSHNNKFKPKTWHEKARKVMYWLSMSVSDSMIVHIQDAKSLKQAWDTLVKMHSTNTQACKMQLKQELHNL
jgi:hypothetical protein